MARTALACLACLVLVARGAGAEPAPTAVHPAAATTAATPSPDGARYRPIGALEYTLTGVLGVGYVAVELGAPRAERASWTGPILFDGGVRDGLRLRTRQARDNAGTASDATALATLAFVATDLGFAWGQSGETALHVAVMDVQVFALTGLVTRGLQLAAPRERPDVVPCERDPEYSGRCLRGAYEDFPSGHAATAAAAAGLTCAHHQKLHLYGPPAADLSACAAAATSAVATGVLRIMEDRHYASDVLTGLAIGGSLGYLLPALGHYRPARTPTPRASARPRLLALMLPSRGLWPTLAVVGAF